ncbi:MAG: histidinol dehydrogenase, partial [Deltaproteobacteria bacterium]|nr:histidinol dehydrogenase [Deltaproteobacteria bacterium]
MAIARIAKTREEIDHFRRILNKRRNDQLVTAYTGSNIVSEIINQFLSVTKSLSDRDDLIIRYTKQFDGWNATGQLRVSKTEIDAAYKKVSKNDLKILKLAASRIRDFHKRQIQKSWQFKDKYGSVLGQKVTPLERVGIYVPGGKATYPSTVLMNAIPAKAAGVKEVIMVTPNMGGKGISKYVLAAAKIVGVDRVFQIGGAQAIAALAFGTKTIPKVDKITGPGNIYVATAKRLVYGVVDIDMIAGPSEILIINDGSGCPSWIAADLLSQAEHDEFASSMLITTSDKTAKAVNIELDKMLSTLSKQRAKIAKLSLHNCGQICVVKNLKEAVDISNEAAPEHLELFVKKPEALLKKIKNAGAIFLGANTPEAAGDYLAGSNHTLPTGGTARFSSPLGVEDFIKRTSVIGFSKKGIDKLGGDIKRFA